MQSPKALFWFRRDLRLTDNRGLAAALAGGEVLPIFIFDTEILGKLTPGFDPRVQFIHQEIEALKTQLEAWGSTLRVYYSSPQAVFQQIKTEFPALQAIFTNRDYEPYARTRDAAVKSLLAEQNLDFKTYKDHVVFEEQEVLSLAGTPFTVYTPYSKVWRAKLQPADLAESPINPASFWKTDQRLPVPSLAEMGFEARPFAYPSRAIETSILEGYAHLRDTPAVAGTSQLSLHLRFGTVSIRHAFRVGFQHSDKWVSELIWREFYQAVLANFPHVATSAFKPDFDAIPWRTGPAAEADFEAWCQGKTGYAIVDAGMRQLNQEHWMHNRVRMVVASFLSKHLLLDWRWGEVYFAQKLLDYDMASNIGGWQWAAGTGADAAPYFRVFNPALQLAKHDPDLVYTRQYVPEYDTLAYQMQPIVDHAFARNRALEAYSVGLKGKPVREV